MDLEQCETCSIPGVVSEYIAQDEFAEFFTPPQVAPIVRMMGGRAELSLDVHHSGGGVDLLTMQDRAWALHELQRRRPKTLGLSPPCTYKCKLHVVFNRKKMSPEKCALLESESQHLINFAMLCARIQKAGGRAFYFEHPRMAETWGDDEVVAMDDDIVHFDQC